MQSSLTYGERERSIQSDIYMNVTVSRVGKYPSEELRFSSKRIKK